ncbi:hypothetical protein OESDEN_17824 [Oesophagostomum dentatum]|uniref:Uncharacterized protein n=1 Tax=Oesophagostomum dentatum TaxID=61180 RepID=A0A0B1SG19_OESDE|nr:hypothetical protein OESDEN_17824 [Oesophagostomum dentatum]
MTLSKDSFLLFFVCIVDVLVEHHALPSTPSNPANGSFSTTSGNEMVPISPINSPVTISVPTHQNYSSELLSCFGKERLACAVNQDFNRALDKYVGSGRLDKIVEILREEAKILCTPEEDNIVSEFLDDYEPAVQVAHQVTTNLSSSDKDQLNFMDNLNDTNAERLFYLNKFGVSKLFSKKKLKKIKRK